MGPLSPLAGCGSFRGLSGSGLCALRRRLGGDSEFHDEFLSRPHKFVALIAELEQAIHRSMNIPKHNGNNRLTFAYWLAKLLAFDSKDCSNTLRLIR